MYIYRFNPDYHFRTVTVNVNGDFYYDVARVWCHQNDLTIAADTVLDSELVTGEYADDVTLNAMRNVGYTFTYTVEANGKTIVKSGPLDHNEWLIFIPSGHEDITVNIVAKNEDVLTNGNLTLVTLGVEYNDDEANVEAGNIWQTSNNQISYNVQLAEDIDLSDVESISWTETVYVVAGSINYEVAHNANVVGTIDRRTNRVGAFTEANYGTTDNIVVVVSDLKVNEVEPEAPTIDATATLTRGTDDKENELTATVKTAGDVGGYASFQLQVSYNGETWTNYGSTVGTGAFTNDTATCTFTVEDADTGRMFRVVANGDVQYGDGEVTFEAISNAIS